jgi:hypothetical protein
MKITQPLEVNFILDMSFLAQYCSILVDLQSHCINVQHANLSRLMCTNMYIEKLVLTKTKTNCGQMNTPGFAQEE